VTGTAAALVVERAGPLTTVQDLGRPGLAHLGVPRSGAADAAALRLANRLVGNPETAAGLETTMLGADVRLTAGRWVAVTGADCEVRVDGRAAGTHAPRYVPPGGRLEIGPALRGLRSYLAVGGGIGVEPVLGSRSTDTLSGIGPQRPAEGAVLPLGEPARVPAPVDIAPRPGLPDVGDVRLLPGPRHDRFTPAALRTLTREPYTVSADGDRVGVRLDGPALERSDPAGLPSEGVVLGAVQVPAGGRPLVFLADHPTTGGYPVVAVVHPDDLWQVAQARPGTRLRFRWYPVRRR
jgi:biotin-dependent carboxylase-like uncharacterized protein